MERNRLGMHEFLLSGLWRQFGIQLTSKYRAIGYLMKTVEEFKMTKRTKMPLERIRELAEQVGVGLSAQDAIRVRARFFKVLESRDDCALIQDIALNLEPFDSND